MSISLFEVIFTFVAIIPIAIIVLVIILVTKSAKNNPINKARKDIDKEENPSELRKKLIKQTENLKLTSKSIEQIVNDLKYVTGKGITTKSLNNSKSKYYLKLSKHTHNLNSKKRMCGICYSYVFGMNVFSKSKKYTFCKVGPVIIELITQEEKTIIKRNNQTVAILDYNTETIKNKKGEVIGKRKEAGEIIITPHGERVATEHIIIQGHQIGTILAKPPLKLFGKKPDDHQFANIKGAHSKEAIICLGIILDDISRRGHFNFMTITGPGIIHT